MCYYYNYKQSLTLENSDRWPHAHESNGFQMEDLYGEIVAHFLKKFK